MASRLAATAARARRLHAAATAPRAGQPTRESHPQLLAAGEVTPGISGAEYAARRSALAARLPPGSVVVVPAAPVLRFHGTAIPVPSGYRQDANFFYLTGCGEPGVVAVLECVGGGAPPSYTLACAAPDDGAHRAWWNARVSPATAAHLGADEAVTHEALPEVLAAALRRCSGRLVWDGPGGALLDLPDAALPAAGAPGLAARALRAAAKALGATALVRGSPLRPALAPLRWRKSPAEAALMRASAQLSAAGLAAAAGACVPGAIEGAAAAAHEAHCRSLGASRLAYPSVCGSGVNACAIHHGRYDGVLCASDAFLMDAGCELHGYCSDVTRTWPVVRRFSAAQRALYDVVVGAHAACLAAVRPGASLASLHELAVRELSHGIAEIGLVPGATAAQMARGSYFSFFPHALGHGLGLDTHDTPSVPGATPLQPGCVITVEPGLYVWPDQPGVNDAFRGIGVRIEDDVLITEAGAEVLSRDAPTAAADVEDWAHAAREEAQAAAAAASAWRKQRTR